MTSFFRFLLVSLAFTLGTINFSHAASFDCSKATTETEIGICENPMLSEVDDLISIGYSIALKHPLQKELILKEQREWIKERDEIWLNFDSSRYEDNKRHLINFMLKRVRTLFEIGVGTEYQSIKSLLEDRNVKISSDELGRLLLFETDKDKGTLHNAMFFDQSQNLTKTIVGQIYDRDGPCEEWFFFSKDAERQNEFTHHFSCGVGGRHGWNETTYAINPECVEFKTHTVSSGQFNDLGGKIGTWSLNDGKKICLEQQKYDPGTEGLEFDSDRLYPNSSGGLLLFLVDYWINSPIEASDNCSASPEMITEVKLLNLYGLLSRSNTLLDVEPLNTPNENSFLGYQDIPISRYSNIVRDYEKNKNVYDLFLPLAKFLDQDGSLKKYITNVLTNYENNTSYKVSDCNLFKVVNGDFYRETYFNCAYGCVPYYENFWKSRKIDGTAKITREILIKLEQSLKN